MHHNNWNTLAYLPTALAEDLSLARIPGPMQMEEERAPMPPMERERAPMPPMERERAPMPPMEQIQTPDMKMAPGHEIYHYPQNLPGALELIEDAVASENEDRLFYQYLINNAPTEEEKEIIRGIRENEITHYALFRQIYNQLTGKMLPVAEDKPVEPPSSYCAGIKKAIIGEQNAVQKYRKILFAMQNRAHINMLTEIITDEIRHGSLYNYIYAKNSCKD